MIANHKFTISLIFLLTALGIFCSAYAMPGGAGHPHTFTSNKNSYCIGDSVLVSDTCVHDPFQPTSRLWSFSQGANPSIISNVSQASVIFTTPGIKTITLSVYDIFNVAYTDTIQVIVKGSIANAGVDKIYCSTSSGVLIGVADTTTVSVQWSNSAQAIIGSTRVISVAPSSSEYFYLQVTKDACVSTDSVWVQFINSPSISMSQNATVCNGNGVTIGPLPQPTYTYTWFPASGLNDSTLSQVIATPGLNTVYTLFVTDTNQCTSSMQVTVNVVNNLVANPGSNLSICYGDSVKLGNPAKAGWIYSWKPTIGLNQANLAQPLAYPKSTTTYQLTVSAYGCVDSNSIQLTVKPLPLVDLQGRHLYHVCFNDSLLIGGTPITGYHYTWTPANNLLSPINASSLVFPSKDTWYTLKVLGTNGCSNKDSLFVDIFDSIKAFAGLDQQVCLGNSIILGAQQQVASGGTGNYNYLWLPSATLNNNSIDHPTATTSASTSYILKVSDGNNSKCGVAYDTVRVTIFPLPNFQLPFKKVFCRGDSTLSLSASPSGGQFEMIVNNNLVPLVNQTFNPNDTLFHTGVPYILRYTYTSPQGCTYDTAVSMLIKNKPTANAGADIFYCPARGYYAHQLLGNGTGTSVHWFPSNSVNNDTLLNPIVSNLVSQSFILQVDNGACSALDTCQFIVCQDSVYLTANFNTLFTKLNKSDSIQVELNDSSSIDKYHNSSYKLSSGTKNGIGYLQTFPNRVEFYYTPFNNFVGFDTAIYILRDTFDLRVYSDTAIVLIHVGPDAVNDYINAPSESFVCGDSMIQLSLNDHLAADQNYTIELLKDVKHFSYTIKDGTLYFHANVESFDDTIPYVLSQNGLSDTAFIYFHYHCPKCHCQIPEGFSPNNDGKNDYLELLNAENCIPDCSLIIYNRWGNVVFRTEHYETYWDGKYNGVDLPDGTYFYLINSAQNTSGGKTSGFLILQR